MGTGAVVGQTLVASAQVDALVLPARCPRGGASFKPVRRVAPKCSAKWAAKPLAGAGRCGFRRRRERRRAKRLFLHGQRCTASSRVLVTQGIHDRFVAAVVAKLGTLKVDHALKPGTDIGPVVDARQLASNLKHIDIAQAEGATLAFGGEPLTRETPGFISTLPC